MDYALTYLLSFIIISFIISLAVAFLVSRLGKRLGLADNPNERSSHSITTPRGGGVGIWLSFLAIGFLLQDSGLKFLVYASGVAGAIGLVEDIYGISSKIRLLFQLILSAVIVAAYSNFAVHLLLPASILLFLFFVLFISGTANFYNFMDGINGISGLTGVVAFGLMAYFSAFISNEPFVVYMSVVIVSACLGFLPFNFPKAKVFMGDAGSVFLGFVFASFVVKLSKDISIFFCLVMFLCTFYADAMVTIFYRWRKGENLIQAHRSHLYQYMSNELGLPHWKVSTLYAIVQLIIGLLAIWTYRKNLTMQVVLVVVYGVLFIFSYKCIKLIKFLKPQQKR